MKRICGHCGGRGWREEIGTRKCWQCAGTGRDLQSDLWAEPCWKCNGSGQLTYNDRVTCRSCNGSGHEK